MNPTQIEFKLYGNAGPILVMIHGLQSSYETFFSVAEELSNDMRVLIYSQRGHGRTPAEGEVYSAESMAKDLKEFLDDLQIDKVHLLGHSMGARTAMAFVGLFSDRVQSLIIEDMGAQQRRLQSDEEDLRNSALASKFHNKSQIYKSKDDAYFDLKQAFSYADELVQSKLVFLKNGMWELKFKIDVAIMFGYQGNCSDLTQYLLKKNIPILCMVADFSIGSAMKASCIEHYRKWLPHVQIFQLQGAGHSIHKTHPHEFTKLVKSFIKEQ